MLKAERIAELIEDGEQGATDPLVITPQPDLKALKESGAASIDLRLGTWFVNLRPGRMTHLPVNDEVPESRLTKTHHVPFGLEYVLHPRSFVLAVTLEWIRLPSFLAGSVIGKSSWGRRGLIIATATGVHPGFTGCLTLEVSNVGEIPVSIRPGMTICQLSLYRCEESDLDPGRIAKSRFVGRRKPTLGKVHADATALRLSAGMIRS